MNSAILNKFSEKYEMGFAAPMIKFGNISIKKRELTIFQQICIKYLFLIKKLKLSI
jgi:hypothetical protein